MVSVADVSGQTRKELEYMNESMKKLARQLTDEKEQILAEQEKYIEFYNYFRGRYITDTTKSQTVDETLHWIKFIHHLNDSASTEFKKRIVVLEDSLGGINKYINQVKRENEVFTNAIKMVLSEVEYPVEKKDFVGEWKLFLAPVTVVSDSMETGLVSFNKPASSASMSRDILWKIAFWDHEMAQLFFKNGKEVKCFYRLNGFNPAEYYSITFNKMDQVNVVLYVSHVPLGIQVSYHVQDYQGRQLFYYGIMRR